MKTLNLVLFLAVVSVPIQSANAWIQVGCTLNYGGSGHTGCNTGAECHDTWTAMGGDSSYTCTAGSGSGGVCQCCASPTGPTSTTSHLIAKPIATITATKYFIPNTSTTATTVR